MLEVSYRAENVTVKRAGYCVLVSDAEHGRSLVVPEDVARPSHPHTDRARALVRATGRLVGLFRDALAAAAGADFRPDAAVLEVLAYSPVGNTDCYRTPPFGGLELTFGEALGWVIGRGIPPQVRRFVGGLVDAERGDGGTPEKSPDPRADREASEIDAVPSDVGGLFGRAG